MSAASSSAGEPDSRSRSWVSRAEEALERGRAAEGDRVLRGRRPPLLDPEGVRAVLAPMLAALFWAAAVFREQVAGSPVDPLALGLRVLALGVSLRVVVLGGLLFRRLATWASARRFGLVLTPQGLLYRTPGLDLAVAREDVLGVVERGSWQERPAGRRWSEVFVVTDPASGRTHLALPPVFEDTPGLLAERLMRWRAPEAPDVGDPPMRAEPAAVASRLYDEVAQRVARGRPLPAGVAAIPHGYGWLRKGPTLPLVVAVAALDGLARSGPAVWEAIGPAIGGGLILAVLAVPARWLWTTRREVGPRRGLSIVLTPAEALMRTAKRMLRVRWVELDRVSSDATRRWSVLEGAHALRQLVLTRRRGSPIRYDEPYLGAPVEVVQGLIEAYRDGRLPRDAPAQTEARPSAEDE